MLPCTTENAGYNPSPSKYAFTLHSSSPSYSMPPRHGLSLQQMPSPCRHSIWNANAESWESRGGNSFATRKYLRLLVYLPSTTSSDIVASPSLVTLPDCRTTPQHIKAYSLTSTSHSVVFPSLLESSAYSPTWHMDRPNPKRHQPDTCRPLETGPWTQSSWTSDATAHAGYAMMMMMMIRNCM